MNDELYQLSDAELSEVFAVDVAGWIHRTDWLLSPWCWQPGVGRFDTCKTPPSYATDANAVLPWLEKHDRWEVNFVGDSSFKEERAYCANVSSWLVYAQTFARAACIALIRAKRSTKLEAK